jgi:hypothetical protein
VNRRFSLPNCSIHCINRGALAADVRQIDPRDAEEVPASASPRWRRADYQSSAGPRPPKSAV